MFLACVILLPGIAFRHIFNVLHGNTSPSLIKMFCSAKREQKVISEMIGQLLRRIFSFMKCMYRLKSDFMEIDNLVLLTISLEYSTLGI